MAFKPGPAAVRPSPSGESMTTSQPTASQSDLLRRHFQSLLDLVPDGIYISDAKGETLFVNSPYQRLTGVSAERVMGRNVVELVENGVFSTVVNPPVVATGQAATLVQEVNGRKVVLSGHPVFDRDGKVDLVVTFVRDITAFDRLKEEIAAQKALLDFSQPRSHPEPPRTRSRTTALWR